jgi:hypothetical protein
MAAGQELNTAAQRSPCNMAGLPVSLELSVSIAPPLSGPAKKKSMSERPESSIQKLLFSAD